jgi:hypothetical protein
LERPKKAWVWAKARRSELLAIRLSKRERAEIDAEAIRTGETPSEVGRRALRSAGILGASDG